MNTKQNLKQGVKATNIVTIHKYPWKQYSNFKEDGKIV